MMMPICLLVARILLELMHHCQSVHDRHHHVGDDKVGQLLACRLQSLQAIVGSEHRVVMAKDGREEEPQVGIVLNDEQRGALSLVRPDVVGHSIQLACSKGNGEREYEL